MALVLKKHIAAHNSGRRVLVLAVWLIVESYPDVQVFTLPWFLKKLSTGFETWDEFGSLNALRCKSVEHENRQHALLLQHNTAAHFWVLNVGIRCIWLSLNNLPRDAFAVPSRGRGEIPVCCDIGLAAEEKMEAAAWLNHILSVWDLASLDYNFFLSLHFWAKWLRWLWQSE